MRWSRGVLERFALDWSTLGQMESLERLVHELEQHGEVDCPNCRHHFYLETNRIEELRHKLASLPLVEPPPLSVREIQKQLDFYEPETLAEWGELRDVAEAPDLDQRAIDQCRRANAAAARRADIEARIAELGEPTDRYEVLLESHLSDRPAHRERPCARVGRGSVWRVGDLVMWDNRCTMHRRDAFDPNSRRIMHRQ